MLKNFKIEEFLSELERLVNIDSGSRMPQGTKKIADYFINKFTELGWQVKYQSNGEAVGPCVQFMNKDADHYDVLLLGHMDTVFPAGTVNERPFKICGDKAYGPGVVDMKASLLFAYYALKDLQEAGKLKDAAVCVSFNSDEEISSVYSRPIIEKLAKRSKYALVMEPARKDGEMVNQRRGVARYTLDATGVAAHAGVNPQDGSSAINELAYWILELHKQNNYEMGTSVNVGVIAGGATPNTIADKAKAEVDVRFTDSKEIDKLELFMKDLQKKPVTPGGAQIKVTGGVRRPPMNPTPATLSLCDDITKIAQKIGVEFRWIATGGGSDASFTAMHGVPTVDGVGPVGAHAHTENEYLEINTLLPRLKLTTATIDHVVNNLSKR